MLDFFVLANALLAKKNTSDSPSNAQIIIPKKK
jgi:hypothetical protein